MLNLGLVEARQYDTEANYGMAGLIFGNEMPEYLAAVGALMGRLKGHMRPFPTLIIPLMDDLVPHL